MSDPRIGTREAKELVDENRVLRARVEALREVLEGVEVFYPEALTLIRELREDAERLYVPDKGYPPHVENARNLGDHEETVAAVRSALAAVVPVEKQPR